MAESRERPPSSKAKSAAAPRPTITPPPRPFAEAFFNGGPGAGFSPGPMTLVSNLFSDSDEYKSFSQLLAGAMASPVAATRPSFFPPSGEEGKGGVSGGGGDVGSRFKQNKPAGLELMVAQPPPVFTVPPGLSPATLLDSPGFGFFSPVGQGPFGMTHQQALQQVTAQAAQAQSQSHLHLEPQYSSSFPIEAAVSLTVSTASNKQIPSSLPDMSTGMQESSDVSHSEQRLHSSSFSVDKPADDGYNWRKYGQKQVKGSEFPRSYYKCTHPSCPVKKKVERSIDGHVTEIIYRGQHNHPPPQSKRAKDSGNLDGSSNNQGNSELPFKLQNGNSNLPKDGTSLYLMAKKDQDSSQATAEHLSATSDSEDAGDTEIGVEKDEDEPEAKRRSTDFRVSEPVASQQAVTEPRIIVQTTSEVDLLDDGYRWRKYGQKVVKGNPYPRSYYKCTTPGCNVRKHVERAATDPKAVITTYEGKHNHDVPAAKTSSHNIANAKASQVRTQNQTPENKANFGNSQQPIARLRLKEEQTT